MRHSRLLRQKIALAGNRLQEAGRRFWRHSALAALLPELMIRTHCAIRASVPLMEAARDRAAEETDPLSTALVDYYEHHIPEERHHDEWLLDDLEAIGVSRPEVLARVPPPTVAAMTGAQYFWIFHHHPAALLGYIAVLEGNPPTVEFLAEVEARTGLPPQAFRTFLKHAHLDVRHRDDLDAAIDDLPLRPEHATLIGISAMHTVQLLGQSLQEIVELHELEKSA